MSADDQQPERQRLILETSRAVDAHREQYTSLEPNWDALHDAVPIEHCDGFMWMSRVVWKAKVIEVYKHGITRRSLHLDHRGHAYRYRRGRYAKIPVRVAVELVFIGIEEQGVDPRNAVHGGVPKREVSETP